ncbi:(+)-neomenthol dehydrogenase-like [Melia azedarach]|uniref:(+)-neomenthol dehydrogenase-like n=1 Tax=Melia azedarach TaxID=155640 RepID=A0ACC1XPX7_MELAZ|nr:(+)-neomenthol dehydrogenase-like [Melia azedarach]
MLFDFLTDMEETNTRSTTPVKRDSVAVVTGANKGIGLHICHQLASNGVFVILTARDEKKGIEAVENLTQSGLSNVVFQQLDIQDPRSVATLAIFVENRFGKLDILVNNAGDGGLILNYEAFRAFKLRGDKVSDENAHLLKGIMEQTYEKTKECLETNYYGTKRVTEAFLPLLQCSKSTRIVNISSFHGQLKFLGNEKAKAELENVDTLTVKRLDEIVEWFLRDFKENKLQANGWPLTVSAYKVSKAAVNAYTRIIASKYPSFQVNCIHPGLVKTDMTCNAGNKTAEEGARAPVMLALSPDGGPFRLLL